MRAGDSNGAKELVNNVRKRYFTASDWAVVKIYLDQDLQILIWIGC